MEPVKRMESKSSLQWKRAALMAKTITAFKETIDVDSDEDVDTKQQIKYGKPSQAAWAIFSEYCDNSTIHGIKYLGEQKRPCLERLFWIMVFVFSIYLCASLTMNIWWKWNNNPVIVSFAEKSTPVWQIPFPAVTVCTETKSRQRFFNFTEMYWRSKDLENNEPVEPLTEEEKNRLDAAFLVCEAHLSSEQTGFNQTNGSELIDILGTIMPQFGTTFEQCRWRNVNQTCDQLFYKYLTDDGICYSFNTLSSEEVFRSESLIDDFKFETEKRNRTDWNVELGYKDNAEPETYPHRVLGPGAKAGLDLVLRGIAEDFDNLCRGPVQGFKILLTTPGEMAQASRQYFRIPFGQEVLIAIKPKIITTSDGLQHYEPSRRQCYFQNERYLSYFQNYTQNNCELECLSNFTMHMCGCVKFSMPRTEDTPVCGSGKINCMNEAEDQLSMREFEQGIATSGENYRGPTSCNCLPSCTSIAYEAEISQADYDHQLSMKNREDEANSNEADVGEPKRSRLSIFFKEAQFLTSKRSELYGTTDFLANCGGLLGLFMGVSTLSIVEIIYFCTVRLITNLKMRRKKRKEMKTLENGDDKKA
ncbi:pickpocket protein 28 [Lucilia sericata]|uniref:pickpocket protein 28 n=1 Tax=Lucilia sericata TaxID=13632 RepID=UPI0018A8027C|nr:pickpocket protein 28 [Lucilia sericata]